MEMTLVSQHVTVGGTSSQHSSVSCRDIEVTSGLAHSQSMLARNIALIYHAEEAVLL